MSKHTDKTRSELLMLDNILQYAPDWIYWKDLNSIHLGCSEQFAIAAGFKSREEMVGKSDYECAWGNRAQKYNLDDVEVIQSGKPKLNIEDTVLLDDGKEVIVISNKVPLRNSKGDIIGVLGIATNITQRKKMELDLQLAKEKAEAANQAKTEFLENMRHDIRTPLTGIVGFADILKMESDSPQLKEYSDNLVASSYALLDLLDEVLEAIRVSSGEIPKLKKKFNLEKTLQHIIELNRAKAAQKKINLSFDFDSTIPAYVIGDKVRIHRVALELIANALNFTDSGSVKLSANLAKQDKQELVIVLIVEDTGIGIPKEKQQEIYVQFKRLTPSYKGIYKGIGLGLSVVKQFIHELDGEIYVESEVLKGSRFTCIIPLQEPLLNNQLGIDEEFDAVIDKPYETTYAQEIKPISDGSSRKEHRVLVVEDNPIAQIVAKSILSQLKCATDIADNGKKAVEMWKSQDYDLIFMDIGLPDLDGYEVTHLIRVQELPKKTHIPIIALTAHVGDENKKRCIDAGMNAILSKPLTAKSCADIVDAFIPSRKKADNSGATLSFGADLPESEDDLFNLTAFPTLDIEDGIKTIGNEETLTEMLRFMVEEALPQDLVLMKNAYDEKDWDKTQQLAHKIKGGAVYVGTIKIKMACEYLERYWMTGQRDLLERLYQQAIAVIDEGTQEIKNWLEKH